VVFRWWEALWGSLAALIGTVGGGIGVWLRNSQQFLQGIKKTTEDGKAISQWGQQLLEPIFKLFKDRSKREQDAIGKFIGQDYIKYVKEEWIGRIYNSSGARFHLNDNDNFSRLRIYDSEFWQWKGMRWEMKDSTDPETRMYAEQRNLEYFTIKKRIPDGPHYILLDSANSGRYILQGSAGSGKTFYLKRHLLEVLKQNAATSSEDPNVPIYIEPRMWIGELGCDNNILYNLAKKSLHDLLRVKYNVSSHAVDEYLNGKFKAGKVYLFIDGLDKFLPDEKDQNEWSKLYDSLVNTINQNYPVNENHPDQPRIPILIAVRSLGEGTNLQGERRIIERLLVDDTRTLVQSISSARWNEETNAQAREELQQLLDRNVRLQVMASNLLGLASLVSMYRDIKKGDLLLPRDRARLYQRFVHAILRGHQQAANPPTTDDRENGLQTLAWHMHKDITQFYTNERIETIAEDYYQDTQKIKDLITYIKWCGLLIQETRQGRLGNTQYRFLNLPLQEYFVACYLLHHQEEAQGIIGEKYNDPWWEEVILLYAYLYYSPQEAQPDQPLPQNGQTQPLHLAVGTLLDIPDPSSHEEIQDAVARATLAARILSMTLPQADEISKLRIKAKIMLFNLLQKEEGSFPARECIARAMQDLGMKRIGREELTTLVEEAVNFQHNGPFDTLRTWAEQIGSENICPVLLPYLAESCNGDFGILVDTAALQPGSLLYNVQALSVQMRPLLISALSLLNRDKLADDLVALLINNEVNQNVALRESIVRSIGMLGNTDHVKTLIDYINNANKYRPEILWNIVDALGVLGERLGYWGQDTICMQQKLDAYIGNGKINAYVCLKIALTLATRIVHMHHRKDSSPTALWQPIIDSIQGKLEFRDQNGIPRKLLKVVTELLNNQNGICHTLQAIDYNALTLEQRIYIWDIVGQLARAGDIQTIDYLNTHYANDTEHIDKCLSIEYTRWRVMRRGQGHAQ
jgi:hypothetical protein